MSTKRFSEFEKLIRGNNLPFFQQIKDILNLLTIFKLSLILKINTICITHRDSNTKQKIVCFFMLRTPRFKSHFLSYNHKTLAKYGIFSKQFSYMWIEIIKFIYVIDCLKIQLKITCAVHNTIINRAWCVIRAQHVLNNLLFIHD